MQSDDGFRQPEVRAPMRMLFHHSMSPGSRVIRLMLGEKGLQVAGTAESFWQRREAFLHLNPAGEVPVLQENEHTVICGTAAIAEFIEEVHPDPVLIGHRPAERAEVRRLFDWFHHKFGDEVTRNLVGEKVIRRLSRDGCPSGAAIRAGLDNIHYHLEYIAWLSERRRWLAGDRLSLADLTAAAHLSVIDYLGDVPWEHHEDARDWYARVKSRPSFRTLLGDAVAGLPPPAHYADLDF